MKNENNAEYPEEPIVQKWQIVNGVELKNTILQMLSNNEPRKLIFIDGRSGNGKSFLADKIAFLLEAPVVHTDDIAWGKHPINWDEELLEKIINPWLAGSVISLRPSGWVEAKRDGVIFVPQADILIIEGVGAGRAGLSRKDDVIIWVQAEQKMVYERAIKRDIIKEGRKLDEAKLFWDKWKSYEDPFFAKDKPWKRANIIINGDSATAQKEYRLVLGPISA